MAKLLVGIRRFLKAGHAFGSGARLPICPGDISAVGVIIDVARQAKDRHEADL